MNTISSEQAIPLTPQLGYILLAISARPLHGYGIMQQITADSEELVTISPGSVYPALRSLKRMGMIETAPLGSPTTLRGERFRLTEAGRTLLELETDRLANFVELSRLRLQQAPPENNFVL